MCGIFGIISDKKINPDLTTRAKNLLKHRGPDGDGEFKTILPDKRELLLVHTRLSIIDLKAGNQPMWDAKRRWVVIFNGEIYNYIELRDELRSEGCQFNTESDTEVLITAISKWGAEKAIPRFNGMFAFAAYCPEREELVLARDRFGIKPIYIVEKENSVYFSSELGALIRLGLTSKKISQPAMELYLSQYSLPAPWSMIEGVEKLRPAYFIRLKRNKKEVVRYWSPQWKPEITNFNEALGLFDKYMKQSLERQFRSDVPVGISLSGGFDSCSILSYSAQELGKKPLSFSLQFDEPSFDESGLAVEMARYSNTRVMTKLMTPKDLWEQMRFILGNYGEPIGDWGVGLVALVSQFSKKEGHKVILVGSGGDELFAGYPTLNAYYYAKQYRKLPRFFKNVLKYLIDKVSYSDKNMSFDFKIRRFLYGADYEPFLGHLKYKEIFNDFEKESLLGKKPSFGLEDILKNIDHLREPQGEERLLWIDFNTFMQSNVLAGFDAASMAYGVEMRVPFLDNDFYDFSLKLSPNIKFSKNQTKPLIRKALVNRIPKSIRNAPKRGFVYPIDQWFRGEFKEQVNKLLDRDKLCDIGLNGDKVLEYWRDHCNGRINRGRQVSAVVSLIIWHEELLLNNNISDVNNYGNLEYA
ncbi:MAG: asparagine synthase (glutamine-hydrolyzing) [Candidatus Omnitrophota bacterium]